MDGEQSALRTNVHFLLESDQIRYFVYVLK